MRSLSLLLGCISLFACFDAAAQFSEVACPAEVQKLTPTAACAVRTSFSFLIFGSMPADTPAQACSIAATLLTQSSNIATACKFDAVQNSCNCTEDGSGVVTNWTVLANPDSLRPVCPANYSNSPRMRVPVTTVDGFHTTMPVCVGPERAPAPDAPPVTPACPVMPLRMMTDPVAIEHERGKFAASSDSERLSAAAAAGKACMLSRSDSSVVFPVSAYRPAEFQSHLKELWDKWHGLLNNTNPACISIREDLRREWLKHKLVRDPQSSPPHASGDAVDIAGLPANMIDATASYCGMQRPDPAAGPLHFQPGRK